MTPYEAAEVMSLWQRADLFGDLSWRVDMREGRNRAVTLLANCSDLFAWATADCEEITRDDIPLLERTLTDLLAVDAEYLLPELFAARKRRMRPQKPCYKDWPPEVAALFDACCTDEERAEFDKRDAAFWAGVVRQDSRP